jgi:hypothetical protein
VVRPDPAGIAAGVIAPGAAPGAAPAPAARNDPEIDEMAILEDDNDDDEPLDLAEYMPPSLGSPFINFNGSEAIPVPVMVHHFPQKTLIVFVIMPWCFELNLVEHNGDRIVFKWETSISSIAVNPISRIVGHSEEDVHQVFRGFACNGEIVITPDQPDLQFVPRANWIRPDLIELQPPERLLGGVVLALKVIVVPKEYKQKAFENGPHARGVNDI